MLKVLLFRLLFFALLLVIMIYGEEEEGDMLLLMMIVRGKRGENEWLVVADSSCILTNEDGFNSKKRKEKFRTTRLKFSANNFLINSRNLWIVVFSRQNSVMNELNNVFCWCRTRSTVLTAKIGGGSEVFSI